MSVGESALLVSIYGVAVSVALLSVLGLRGHEFGPGVSPYTTDILHQVCLSVYGICLMTNLLLFLGLVLPLRPLLVPWLLGHTLLAVALGSASVYYLVLYVNTECGGDCTVLLAYATSLVGAVIILTYCIYLVQDFFDVLKYEVKEKKERKKAQGTP